MDALEQLKNIRFSRNRLAWIVVVSILALVALAIVFSPESDSTQTERDASRTEEARLEGSSPGNASGAELSDEKWHLAADQDQMVLNRKTLDLPSELNISRAELPQALALLEQTSGITFLLIADEKAPPAEVSVQAKDKPLREILAEILAPNGLALALHGDRALVLPCSVATGKTRDGEPAFTETHVTLTAAQGESVEFYAGERNQHRVRIVARLKLESASQSLSWQASL